MPRFLETFNQFNKEDSKKTPHFTTATNLLK